MGYRRIEFFKTQTAGAGGPPAARPAAPTPPSPSPFEPPAVAVTQGTRAAGNYGGGVPALTCRHADLAHGDASAAPAGGLATGATGGSNVGTYPITQGALAATGDCTSGTFHQGTLTVDPASLTVAAGNQAVTCGGGVPGRGVHCESLLHKLLARAFTSEEIDRLKRDFGQVRDLARSAYGLALEVLELHGRGFGPVAIARKLEVSRKSVARVIARGQVPPG